MPRRRRGTSRHPDAKLVPRRTAPLAASRENTPPDIRKRTHASNFHYWSHNWADGERNLEEIARTIAVYSRKEAPVNQIADFFRAHAEIGYVELVPPRDMIRRTRLVEDFRKLGVRPGMDLMVHSSLSAIGHVAGGADTVIDALLQAVGKTGNLMMPSFNHHRVKVYNPLATPTRNGAIPDAFWRRPEAVRSDHPSHPVAVIGPDAERFCARHAEIGVWAPESPIGQLIHGGGYILALGVTNVASTAYHVAEASMGCRCLDSFGRMHFVVAPDGRVREVPGLAWRSQPCPVSPARMDKTLDRSGLQSHGKVGKADATLVKAIDLWKVRREHLRHACPTCKIGPRS
jgi:aminoglycoside 3-N-acetyltransferase